MSILVYRQGISKREVDATLQLVVVHYMVIKIMKNLFIMLSR